MIRVTLYVDGNSPLHAIAREAMTSFVTGTHHDLVTARVVDLASDTSARERSGSTPSMDIRFDSARLSCRIGSADNLKFVITALEVMARRAGH
jgi:hypothetical protein